MLHQISFGSFHFASRYEPAETELDALVKLFQPSDESACSTLEGRCCVSRAQLKGIGPVVVKHYRRGGILGHFIKASYLSTGKKRSQAEFEQMDAARNVGLSVPEPIMHVHRGGLVYQAWLVTREVEQSETIARISRRAPDRLAAVMPVIGRELSLLIDHLILHADFHPGNVLLDKNNKVFLIDFDKAGAYTGGKEALRTLYRRRWRRAVRKHGLPETLCKLDAFVQ
jgi:serine/threonine protein kinase